MGDISTSSAATYPQTSSSYGTVSNGKDIGNSSLDINHQHHPTPSSYNTSTFQQPAVAAAAPSASYTHSDHLSSNPHTQQQQQHPTSSHLTTAQQHNNSDNTFQPPRPPHQASSSSSYQASHQSRSNTTAAAASGNAGNASYEDYHQQQQKQQHQKLTGNYTYSSNMSSATVDGQASQSYPHQSHHPRTDSSYSDTPFQPQAPSATQQGQSSTNNNNNSSNQNVAYPTASSYSSTATSSHHPQRTISGGFETVKAGPPSPGSKMDLLPYPHNHNYQQQSSNSHQQQQQHHSQQGSTSSSNHGNATSTRHRSNRSSHQHSNSQSLSNQANQRSNNATQVPHTPSQAPSSTNLPATEVYHEPVAPSSGRSINSKGSSTTSEFTKRKNWSQRIVEEMQDILIVLSPNDSGGTILFISSSITELCGLKPEDMLGRRLTDFFYDGNSSIGDNDNDDDGIYNGDIANFERDFKNSILSESNLTTYFRFKKINSNINNSSSRNGGLRNLKEEESDDSGGSSNAPHHHALNDSNLSTNTAAEAVAAMNLHSDSLLVELTGTPYYTTSIEGGSSSRSRRGDRRKDRHQGDDYKMAEDGDSEGIPPVQDNGASSSSGGNSSDIKHHKSTSSRNTGSSNKSRTVKTCKCFFAMARPYPSKNNATLDSFLELKIENEKLRMKLADIYREIEGDDGLGNSNNSFSNNNNINHNSSNGIGRQQDYSGMGITHADDGSDFQFKNAHQNQNAYFGADPMAIDTLPGSNNNNNNNRERQISGFPSRISGNGSQQQVNNNNTSRQQQNNLSRQGEQQGQFGFQNNGHQQQQQQISHDSQMQGSTAAPSAINSMRGGPIDSGDGLISSAGLIPSTSNTYGALGIGISASARAAVAANNHNDDISNNQNGQSHQSNTTSTNAAATAAAAEDKKKKMKKQRTDEGEFVCRDCGTVDSPEWRRGPLGPKTLCNACGLRWAKKNKQQQRNSLGGNENILTAK